MNVADVMTPRDSLVTVELPGTRDDALEHLQEGAFTSIPVVKQTDEGEEYRGLVSREGLIQDPDEDQLALLVEEGPTTTADATVQSLVELMLESGARRVAVVDGRLEGIVTVTDVIRAIAEGDVDGDREVGEVGRRSVNCVHRATPLTVVERELHYADVPYGVVLDDEGGMDGIVTAADVIEVARVVEGEDDTGGSIADEDDDWMWEGIKSVGNRYLPTRDVVIPAEPVEGFMTESVHTATRRMSAREVAQLMLEEDIEQVPLFSGDDLVGVVRDVDLLEAAR